MFIKRSWQLLSILVLLAFVGTACGGAAPEVDTGDVGTGEMPTELRVAALLSSTADNPWDESFLISFQRVQEAAPHGLTISDIDFSEGVWGDEAEVVLREYASTGEYDIIWAHSAYSDQVKVLKDEYPEIVWVVAGSGNEPIGDNAYWIFLHVHEVTYLMGRYAGALTETDVIGLVAGFETDDTLDTFNGFVDGAKAVNPNIIAKVSYIESWYDPAKGAEAARAQIAAGADQIYTQSYGFEACVEADIFCYSTYTDNNYLAPEHILVSALSYWDPHIMYIIDEWWNHETEGAPYNAPMEAVWFNMAEGTGELSSLHGLEDRIPAEVIADVNQAAEDIVSGNLQVELKVEPIKSE